MPTSIFVTSEQVFIAARIQLLYQSIQGRIIGIQLLTGVHVVVDTIRRITVIIVVKIALGAFSLE